VASPGSFVLALREVRTTEEEAAAAFADGHGHPVVLTRLFHDDGFQVVFRGGGCPPCPVTNLLLEFFRNRLGTAALRIVETAEERPSLAPFDSHGSAALLALHFDLDRGDGLPLIVDRQGVPALRIAGATQEVAARALA